MIHADASKKARYVVSSAKVSERSASQLYFAGLLVQRRLVGANLCVALRRLRTLAGAPDFDHLRIARYPRPIALDALRTSPGLRALLPWQRRGVRELRVSNAAVHVLPRDWREVRAAWVVLADLPGPADDLRQALANHPALGGFHAFSATLSALPRPRLEAPSPPPLDASELCILAFPSVRLALDALELPEITRLRGALTGPEGAAGVHAWALMERVSLREMLTPG